MSIFPLIFTDILLLLKIMKRIYEDSYGYLEDMQFNYRKCIDFIYDLNGNKELK